MRLLVCGGRDFTDRALLVREMNALATEQRPSVVIHGAARGADTMAGLIAEQAGIPVERYPVDNAIDGPWPAAGMNRNRRMLEASKPDVVLAMPGGRGTAGMVRIARAAGVRVVVLEHGLYSGYDKTG